MTTPESECQYNLEETDKGVSIIARADIPRSTIIIEERPLFILRWSALQPKRRQSDGTVVSGPPWQIAVNTLRQKLTPQQQAIYDALSYAHESLSAFDRNQIFMSPDMERTIMRFNTNALELGMDSKDLGVFQTCSRLNHSCTPSAQFTWSEDHTMVVTAVRDIKPDEEITISYTDLLATAEERRENLAPYGFRCNCPACEGADATLQDALRMALVHINKQLDEYDLGRGDMEDPKVALGLATASIHMLNSTGITGHILDEA